MRQSRPRLANFPTLHRELLTIFEKTRLMPKHLALREIHTFVEKLRQQVCDFEDTSVLRAYFQYLKYFASRLDDPFLAELATAPLEAMLAKDPSRYDLLLLLAQHHLSLGRHTQAFPLLKKIAASRFSEEKEAQRFLERHVEDVFE